jgi:hypothetical protein
MPLPKFPLGDNLWGKSVVGNHKEHADVNNSIDTFLGKEIVLDLSLITEHVQQEDLIASISPSPQIT